jgi:ABC-type transport system involved in Fe-S cluster assembly fused permease/ATPase subunit
VLAKSVGIASPFILKRVVNSLTLAGAAGKAATGFSLARTIGDVGLWGLTRVFSSVFLCYQMNACTAGIQSGLRRIASASFNHQLDLDLDYHKKGSKNTVFEINRALRSLDQGLRFFMGFCSQMALEFVFLCFALQLQCGTRYFANMIVTFIAYSWYTNSFSERRIKQIREKKQIDKKQEFYQNESITNYETVKQFNNEELEKNRYGKILDKMTGQALVVQRSLSTLNIG